MVKPAITVVEQGGYSPEVTAAQADKYHYGWRWSGPEEVSWDCVCDIAPCGLVTLIHPRCLIHEVTKIGTAKQIHKSSDCPA